MPETANQSVDRSSLCPLGAAETCFSRACPAAGRCADGGVCHRDAKRPDSVFLRGRCRVGGAQGRKCVSEGECAPGRKCLSEWPLGLEAVGRREVRDIRCALDPVTSAVAKESGRATLSAPPRTVVDVTERSKRMNGRSRP